jgi:hypothetical protein
MTTWSDQLVFQNLISRIVIYVNLLIFVIAGLFLSACGSSTSDSSSISGERNNQQGSTYETLLGKTLDDNVVSDFILQNNCQLSGFHYICKSIGVELSLDSGQRVVTVFMYAQGVDGFDEYTGDLPYGLTWNSTRSDVQGQLGSPNAQGTETYTSWDAYQDRGVYVDYDSPSAEDLSARMIRIQVQTW